MFFRKKNPQKIEHAAAGALLPGEWERSMSDLISSVDFDAKSYADRNWEEVYSFIIDMLGRELVGYYAYRGFDDKYGVDLRQLVCIPSCMETRLEKEVRLMKASRMNMICFPRNMARFPIMLNDVKTSGYVNGPNEKCCGTYYPELNLCIVSNRHHHAAAAKFYGVQADVDIKITVKSIKPLFDKLRVGCNYRWSSLVVPEVSSEPVDPRFAAMYELARRREMLLQNAQ